MTAEEVRQALAEVIAALGDLTIGELEQVACLASELRQHAWNIRAVKLAAEIRSSRG